MKIDSYRETLPSGVLASLEVAVLESVGESQFRLVGTAPEWFTKLFGVSAGLEPFTPADYSTYLQHFLVDARSVWEGSGNESWTSSGPFTETLADGAEVALEAIALVVDHTPVLLVKYPTTDHDTVRELLQKSRTQSIEYGRLIKEVNKRELLLHCIVHDLSTPLAGVKGSLELLQNDGLILPEGKKLQEISMNQIAKMQSMIGEILQTFRAEIGHLVPTIVEHSNAPDVATCASEVSAALRPLAAESGNSIDVSLDAGIADSIVAADASRLERVVFNLVDNALRHAPADSQISIKIEGNDEKVRTHVVDRGPGVEAGLKPRLFERHQQGTLGIGKAGLGLYFCRITVADWGGTIGYDDVPGGGADFWFEIPRPIPSA